jgi:hypothetical protein
VGVELWSTATGNRLGGYAGLREALVTAQEIAEIEGLEAVDELAVVVWPEDGTVAPASTIEGHDLRRLLPRTRTVSFQVVAAAVATTGPATQRWHLPPLAIPA